jgi:hypothetical protein
MSRGPASGSSSFESGELTPNSVAAVIPYTPPRKFGEEQSPCRSEGFNQSSICYWHILLAPLSSDPFLFSFCYHAATRTGQISPICAHLVSILVCVSCEFRLSEVVLMKFLNRESRIRLRRQLLEVQSEATASTMVGSPRLHLFEHLLRLLRCNSPVAVQ